MKKSSVLIAITCVVTMIILITVLVGCGKTSKSVPSVGSCKPGSYVVLGDNGWQCYRVEYDKNGYHILIKDKITKTPVVNNGSTVDGKIKPKPKVKTR